MDSMQMLADGMDHMVVGPADGARMEALGMWHKVGAGSLDGRLLVVEGEIRPGQLVLPHTHTREDECAYVLSGELTYQIGDAVRTVSAGTYVIKPRNVRHAFWNAGTHPARVMEMHVPAAMDRFYGELAGIFSNHVPGTPEWQQAFTELNERHGITQHWDRVAQISERYGVGAARS